jgi:hypothetical protein
MTEPTGKTPQAIANRTKVVGILWALLPAGAAIILGAAAIGLTWSFEESSFAGLQWVPYAFFFYLLGTVIGAQCVDSITAPVTGKQFFKLCRDVVLGLILACPILVLVAWLREKLDWGYSMVLAGHLSAMLLGTAIGTALILWQASRTAPRSAHR